MTSVTWNEDQRSFLRHALYPVEHRIIDRDPFKHRIEDPSEYHFRYFYDNDIVLSGNLIGETIAGRPVGIFPQKPYRAL